VIGLALNVAHIPLPKLWHEVADALDAPRSPLPFVNRRRPAPRRHVPAEPRRFSSFVPQAGADAVIAVSLALWFGLSGSTLASSPPAPRCRHRRAPMCWPGRWAATRRCWRNHHAADEFWRQSRCRSRSQSRRPQPNVRNPSKRNWRCWWPNERSRSARSSYTSPAKITERKARDEICRGARTQTY